MRVYFCDHFVLPLPETHRFPMEKYRLLRERVGGVPGIRLTVPEAATPEALARVHTADWIDRVCEGRLTREEIRDIGFPWSPKLVERSRRSVGGTVGAAFAALEDGAAASLAGGTHHAFADHGEGFCVFNDVAVAARAVQAARPDARLAVLDMDVHQGNGTAAIFADDPSVRTISVHGAGNYPFRKERSDLDIELPDGATDAPFLDAVAQAVRVGLDHDPALVFHVAGADPYERDRLGRLSVSKEGLRERDALILDACAVAGVPVAVVMSGGYAEDVDDTVEIHATTVRMAAA